MRRYLGSTLTATIGCALLVAVSMPAAEVKVGGDEQWVVDAGGRVIKDAAGKITGVDLRASWVTDTDLRKLLQLPNLSYLDLSLTRITDQGMQDLRGLQNIVELNLSYAEYVTDEGLAAIKEWKKLKRLNVQGTKISDTTLEHIGGILTLESLNAGSAMVTDVGLERLSGLPNLHELTIGGNKLSDNGLQPLRQMPSITYLNLNGRQGTDANVWAISMSEVGLGAILSLKNLRELHFGCTSLSIGLEGQKFGTVSNQDVGIRWVEKLKALPNLERLSLQSCRRVDDEAAKVLATLPSLKAVDLKGTGVTEKGVAALKAAKPQLSVSSGAWDAPAAAFRNN